MCTNDRSDACRTCDSALARSDGKPPRDIDIGATTAALLDRVNAGLMRELAGDVDLEDMVDLFASDQKYTIVSYLECGECGRLLCWGLCIRSAPIFEHVDRTQLDDVIWDEVPERFRWVGAASFEALEAGAKADAIWAAISRWHEPTTIERAVSEMTVEAHLECGWLLSRGFDRFLEAIHMDASLGASSRILFRLDSAERAAYAEHGSGHLVELSHRINHGRLWRPGHPYHARNLYRGRRGPHYRAHASAAIRDWAARQIRPGACDVCSLFWVDGTGGAESLGTSDVVLCEVQRCRHCGAYWEVRAFTHPSVISRGRARQALPDLERRESALGIDFPDPPPLPVHRGQGRWE